MSKGKFSKRKLAGALLLSSTTVGSAASGTANAGAFSDSVKNFFNVKTAKYASDLALSSIKKLGERSKIAISLLIQLPKILYYNLDLGGYSYHTPAMVVESFKSNTYTGRAMVWLGSKISQTDVYKNIVGPILGSEYTWSIALGVSLVYGYYKQQKDELYFQKNKKLIDSINDLQNIIIHCKRSTDKLFWICREQKQSEQYKQITIFWVTQKTF